MNSPSVDIGTMLVNDLGLILGLNLFISKTPTSPDKCVTVIDSGGYNPSLPLSKIEVIDNPAVQILVRGNKQNYLEAYALLEEIKRYLHGKSQHTVGLTRYIIILAESDILSLGYDDNNRPLLSCNFLINRTE